MITLSNLIKKQNLELNIPSKLKGFELYIDDENYTYSKENHGGDIVHVFEGKVKEVPLIEIIVFYNENKKELSLVSDGRINTYNKEGKHIIMT